MKYTEFLAITQDRLHNRDYFPRIHEATEVAVFGLAKIFHMVSDAPKPTMMERLTSFDGARRDYLKNHGVDRMMHLVALFGNFKGTENDVECLPWVIAPEVVTYHGRDLNMTHFGAASEIGSYHGTYYSQRGIQPDAGYGYITVNPEGRAAAMLVVRKQPPPSHMEALGRVAASLPEMPLWLVTERPERSTAVEPLRTTLE